MASIAEKLAGLDLLAKKLKRRVFNMVVRGAVNIIDDSGGLQLVQATLLSDETRGNLERVQNYGFTSHPLVGSECLVLFMGGNRDHGVVVAVDDRNNRKVDLEAGDVAMYSGAGNFIRLQFEDGKVYIDAPDNTIIRSDETVRLEGKSVQIHGGSGGVKIDANGVGWHITEAGIVSYTDGAASSTVPPVPPEIPPAAAE